VPLETLRGHAMDAVPGGAVPNESGAATLETSSQSSVFGNGSQQLFVLDEPVANSLQLPQAFSNQFSRARHLTGDVIEALPSGFYRAPPAICSTVVSRRTKFARLARLY